MGNGEWGGCGAKAGDGGESAKSQRVGLAPRCRLAVYSDPASATTTFHLIFLIKTRTHHPQNRTKQNSCV